MTTCPPAAGSWEKVHSLSLARSFSRSLSCCVCVCLRVCVTRHIGTMKRMLTQNKQRYLLHSADFRELIGISCNLLNPFTQSWSQQLLKPDDWAQICGHQVAQTADICVSDHLSVTKCLNEWWLMGIEPLESLDAHLPWVLSLQKTSGMNIDFWALSAFKCDLKCGFLLLWLSGHRSCHDQLLDSPLSCYKSQLNCCSWQAKQWNAGG